MEQHNFNRRSALGALGGFGSPIIGTANAAVPNSFEDPIIRFEARLKTTGTLTEETVHRLSTGHVWMYHPETHRFDPFCTMENYNVSEWTHDDDGIIRSRMFEVAVYLKFGTDEVMEEWVNPFTDEKLKVHHYVIGPMLATHDPRATGADAGAENAERVIVPNHLNWMVMGDTVYMPTDSSVAYKNPLQPDIWPRASAGESFGWDSFIMFAAKLEELADPKISQVMAHSWYQENTRWQPWMLMGQRPGRLVARGYGKKMRWDEIPADRLRRMEKYVPEVLDRENWGDFQNEFLWYLRNQKPKLRLEPIAGED
jgi:hypothetical protein